MALLVDVLDQTKQAAVVQALTTVQGPLENPGPTTPQLLALFQQYQQATQQVISQQAGLIDLHSSTIQQLAATLASLQAALPGQITDALTAYNASIVAPLVQQQGALTTSLSTLQSTVTTNATTTTAALAAKAPAADVSALATAVSSKASASDLQALATTVAGKAPASDLATTNTTVAANTAAINLRATTAALATEKGRIDSLLTTTVPGLQTDIGNRLRKDQPDTTAYPLGVPVASGMDKAVQKSELVGGIQRPYRVFQGVASTPVGAYVRAGQTAAVVDGLGLGQVLALTAVRIKPTVAPLVASVIKLYSNGTEVYSTTVALATLPAVGKTLDLLALTGASLPVDIALPAVLTMSASAGTFEIITDGILK